MDEPVTEMRGQLCGQWVRWHQNRANEVHVGMTARAADCYRDRELSASKKLTFAIHRDWQSLMKGQASFPQGFSSMWSTIMH